MIWKSGMVSRPSPATTLPMLPTDFIVRVRPWAPGRDPRIGQKKTRRSGWGLTGGQRRNDGENITNQPAKPRANMSEIMLALLRNVMSSRCCSFARDLGCRHIRPDGRTVLSRAHYARQRQCCPVEVAAEI